MRTPSFFSPRAGMFSRLPTIGETEKTALTIKTAIEKSWLTRYFTLASPWTSNFMAAMESAESYLQQEPDESYDLTYLVVIYGRAELQSDCDRGTTEGEISGGIARIPLIDVPQAGKL